MRLRQRKAIIRQLAEYFAKTGKVPADRREYAKMEDAPIRVAQLSCYFGAWTALLDLMQKQEPELWAEINKPKVAPKPAVAKPAPKPVAKPVVKKEKSGDE